MPKKTFTEQERAAIQERAREAQAEERRGPRADIEDEVLAKIADMKDSDRAMAKRLHAVIKTNVPELAPKLWYGMPAYAKNGKIICFFQAAAKFKTRYAELGFNDPANLDDGAMWPTSYAVTRLTAAVEKNIATLVKKAAS